MQNNNTEVTQFTINCYISTDSYDETGGLKSSIRRACEDRQRLARQVRDMHGKGAETGEAHAEAFRGRLSLGHSRQ